MRIRFRHLLISLPIGIGLLAAAQRPEVEPTHPYFSGDEFLVAAHRGGKLLGPEGTLRTFRHAVSMGVQVLEMDVRRSADGVLVIHHDSRVDRTTEGTGRIDSLNVAQLQSLDAGYHWRDEGGRHPFRGQGLRIPTLEEIFRAFPHQRLLLEIKPRDTDISRALCEAVRGHRLQERVVVTSFSGEVLDALRDACPEVATSASPGEVTWYWLLHRLRLDNLYAPDFQVFQVPENMGALTVVDRSFIESAHARNLPVHVWTVNLREDMRRLLDLGVDGIITDRPDLMLELLRERKL
ncbi:MAG: glycerophosphodiester phosphodiesterase [Candidatus Latescibacterota bacterium]|nr:glycerophosphodiester phosphodiesterase [Candidatus Latescibacterota bacterium]